MANKWFNAGKEALFERDVDGATLKAVMCMSNTTADTENDSVSTVADITTLDEFDGTGYTAGGETLAGVTVTKDDANDRAILDATDLSGLTYGDGTRQIAGVLVILFDTDLNTSIPLLWIDDGGFPFDGSNFTGVTWNAAGLAYAA